MKQIVWALLLFTTHLYAQNANDTCNYAIEKTGEGKYKATVTGFGDTSNISRGCFYTWVTSGTGKADGEYTIYDEHGQKRWLAIFKDGLRTGTHLQWYATGELFCETVWETHYYYNTKAYYKSGGLLCTTINGNRGNKVLTDYYENGKVKYVFSYIPDFEKRYYESGRIQSEKIGRRRIYKEWHPNGRLKVKGRLNEAAFQRVGKWLFYDDNGKLVRKLFYAPKNDGWYRSDRDYRKEILYN